MTLLFATSPHRAAEHVDRERDRTARARSAAPRDLARAAMARLSRLPVTGYPPSMLPATRTSITLALGLAAGFLLAMTVLRAGGPRTPSDRDPSVALRQDGGAALAHPEPDAPELALVAPTAGSVASERVAAEAQPLEAPQGSAERLVGLVLGPDDVPLAGATIVGAMPEAPPTPSSQLGQGYRELSLDEELARARERVIASRARRRIARSGADGTFSIELPSSARAGLRAYLEGYRFEPDREERLGQTAPGSPVILRGRPVRWLTFDVRMPDGSQPAEALIELTSGGSKSSTRMSQPWTPTATRIESTFDSVTARAQSAPLATQFGMSTYRFASAPVNSSGHEDKPVVLQLAERTYLSIELVDPSAGKDTPEAWVRVIEAHRFDPQHPGRNLAPFMRFEMGEQYARVDGRHVFLDLEQGEWMVLAGRGPIGDDIAPAATQRVTVGAGETRCRIAVPPLDLSEYRTITCLGPEGQIVRDVQFSIRHQSDNGTSSSGLNGVTKLSDGTYRVAAQALAPQQGSGVTSGVVKTQLMARHAELGTTVLDVRPDARELRLRFDAPGTLIVEVLGYVRGDYAVNAESVTQEFRTNTSDTKLEAEGRATLQPLAPGTYEVSLYSPNGPRGTGFSDRKRLASVTATVRSGENRVQLTLPALYDLRIEAPNLSRGETLRLRRPDERGYDSIRAERDADGVATLTGVPAGEYDIVSDDMYAPQRITVPPTTHVYDPVPLRAMSVTIADNAGLLYVSGFRDGDLLIGVDGVEFKSLTAAQAAFLRMVDGTVEWMVVRGGETLSVRAGEWGAPQGFERRAGGKMQPAAR